MENRIEFTGNSRIMENTLLSSGYKLAKQLKDKRNRNKEEADTSHSRNKMAVWKELWKLKIKHKLKHFLWKCFKPSAASQRNPSPED